MFRRDKLVVPGSDFMYEISTTLLSNLCLGERARFRRKSQIHGSKLTYQEWITLGHRHYLPTRSTSPRSISCRRQGERYSILTNIPFNTEFNLTPETWSIIVASGMITLNSL